MLGAVALLLARCRDRRILLSLAVLCVAFLGLVQTTQIDAKLGPSEGGTYGRSLEDWGGFLSPALVELREDALRRYVGRPTEPGGPLYDPDQILSSFSVRGVGRVASPVRGGRRALLRRGPGNGPPSRSPAVPRARDHVDRRPGDLGGDRRRRRPVRRRRGRVLQGHRDVPGARRRCSGLGPLRRRHRRPPPRRPLGLLRQAQAGGPTVRDAIGARRHRAPTFSQCATRPTSRRRARDRVPDRRRGRPRRAAAGSDPTRGRARRPPRRRDRGG